MKSFIERVFMAKKEKESIKDQATEAAIEAIKEPKPKAKLADNLDTDLVR